jgi:hypothetical protein
MTLYAMRVAAIMVGMLVSLVFAKKLAGEEWLPDETMNLQ